mmetsp:Transcript_5844/g.9473  ORF Transcript_5844/g.9473 Transcript_5844/m.9473 type:complete len:415 (+) Transcript_5844:52-1296(+)
MSSRDESSGASNYCVSGCANHVSLTTAACFDGIFSLTDRRQGDVFDKDDDQSGHERVEEDLILVDVPASDADRTPLHWSVRCCCRRSTASPLGVIQASDLRMKDLKDNSVECLPIGAGCCKDQELSQELRDLRHQALQLYERRYPGVELTYFQRGWLTAETLQHFANPTKPDKLAKALYVRGQREAALTKQDIWLNGSLRVVGHDLEGTSILSWESATMRKSFSHYMDHAELLIHLALDMNRPGSHGWIHITDYYGWNPLLFLSPLPMVKFASWVEGQFRHRLKLAVFVDMPYGASGMLNFMLNFLKPATRDKVRIFTLEEALIFFRQCCDEETARRIETFLRERRDNAKTKQTWHPIVDLPWFREKLGYLKLSGQEKTILTPEELKLFREHIKTWHQQHWSTSIRTAEELSAY